jgi:hypothetical protein
MTSKTDPEGTPQRGRAGADSRFGLAASQFSGKQAVGDRATDPFPAQLRCVARVAIKRDAPRKRQVCALVRDTTRSQQLFCIHMAKEPPATDQGSLLLVG